jgi:SAM-dependent methyltransferase
MGDWRVRARFYRVFSDLPFGRQALEWHRGRGGRLLKFKFSSRHYSVREMSRMIAAAGIDVRGQDLLEVGSGWHPVLPLMFHGMGARHVTMTDLQDYMREAYARCTLEQMQAHAAEVSEATGVPAATLTERWGALAASKPGDWPRSWSEQGIEYVAPADLTRPPWKEGTFDGIFSNSCLCYIPRPVLEQIFEQMFSLLRPGGWIAHNISLYDDYCNVDSSISGVNFLRFTPEEWDRVGNSQFHYQNRLRPRDYEELARRSGFTVRYNEHTTNPKCAIERINRDELHPDFRDLPDEELTCHHFLFVAQKS